MRDSDLPIFENCTQMSSETRCDRCNLTHHLCAFTLISVISISSCLLSRLHFMTLFEAKEFELTFAVRTALNTRENMNYEIIVFGNRFSRPVNDQWFLDYKSPHVVSTRKRTLHEPRSPPATGWHKPKLLTYETYSSFINETVVFVLEYQPKQIYIKTSNATSTKRNQCQ